MKRTSILLTSAAAGLLLIPVSCTAPGESEHAGAALKVPPGEALALLKAGNGRFAANRLQHPHQSAGRRTELATGQHPIAVVLGCADSRTSPELLFDQGLGDLFVVRVAGNVLNAETVGSIEYAVEHLGAHLIVVLGHERCGAIKAARETVAARGRAPGHIHSLVNAIRPAVEATRGADAEATARANVLNVVHSLQHSAPILHEMVRSGEVAVVGGHYDLDTGVVEFLNDPHAR